MKALAVALSLALLGNAGAAAPIDPAVEALLKSVETSGCRMQRNGEMHDAKDAAAHLRMKLERSGRPDMSATQFIERIASGSSVTGRPYLVVCGDGPPVESRVWLRARLDEQRAPRR